MDSTTKAPFATLSYEWSEEYFSQVADTLNNSLIRRTSEWFFIVWYMLMALILFIIGGVYNVFIGLVLCLCAIYIIWNRYKGYSVSAIYKSYKMYEDLTVFYEFYEKHFVVTDKFGSNTYPYSILYSIKSSKYGYALCLSKVSGFFIPKSACDKQLITLLGQMNPQKGLSL